MKKLILVMMLVVMGLVGYLYSATNGSGSFIIKGNYWVYKYTLTYAAATASETVAFDFEGQAQRIVIDVNASDADGDVTISDISGKNYVNLANKLGSGDVDYIITGLDSSSNPIGGVPVAGHHTMTLTDCAGAAPLTIWVYYKR
jgi:hypothetical protein